jgi:hypothetical protein
MIMQLQLVNNKFTSAIDFRLDNIIAGSITKFVVDIAKSYSSTEQEFLKGAKGRYTISLYTSINILLYKKGTMTMESNN